MNIIEKHMRHRLSVKGIKIPKDIADLPDLSKEVDAAKSTSSTQPPQPDELQPIAENTRKKAPLNDSGSPSLLSKLKSFLTNNANVASDAMRRRYAAGLSSFDQRQMNHGEVNSNRLEAATKYADEHGKSVVDKVNDPEKEVSYDSPEFKEYEQNLIDQETTKQTTEQNSTLRKLYEHRKKQGQDVTQLQDQMANNRLQNLKKIRDSYKSNKGRHINDSELTENSDLNEPEIKQRLPKTQE